MEVRCINRLGDTACRGERDRQVVGNHFEGGRLWRGLAHGLGNIK